jgi:hypothetical protein
MPRAHPTNIDDVSKTKHHWSNIDNMSTNSNDSILCINPDVVVFFSPPVLSLLIFSNTVTPHPHEHKTCQCFMMCTPPCVTRHSKTSWFFCLSQETCTCFQNELWSQLFSSANSDWNTRVFGLLHFYFFMRFYAASQQPDC